MKRKDIRKMFGRFLEAAKKYILPQKTTTDLNNIGDPDFNGYGNWNEILNELLYAKYEDVKKYQEYDLMDTEIPEISTALDIMADYVIYPDSTTKTQIFKVKAKKEYDNSKTSKAIADISNVTNFIPNFWSCVREACKYGDDFEELLRFSDGKVAGISNIDNQTVVVNLNKDGLIDGIPYSISQLDDSNKPITTLTEDKFLHFSLNSDRQRHRKYGKGVSRLEKSRLCYRQLRLAEEGMIIGRLSRANQNHAIMVDVGDLEPDEALKFIEKYRNMLNRRKYIDPQTGRMTYKYNPLSVVEDLFIPTRQGSGAGVSSLNNNGNRGDIDDINYLQNKMIYSTNVPKILIGKEVDVNSKATGDIQFISFLRMIRRIQKILEPQIIKYYKIALKSFGIENVELEIEWPLIGTIDEERRWTIEKMKMEVAAMMTTELALVDDQYVYEKILCMDAEEIDIIKTRLDDEEEMYKDEINAELSQADDVTNYPNDGKGVYDPKDPDNRGYDYTKDPNSPTNPQNKGKTVPPSVDPNSASIKKRQPVMRSPKGIENKYVNQLIDLCNRNPNLKQLLKEALELGELQQ